MADLKPYDSQIARSADGRAYLPVPFDPNTVWGAARHLGGALNARHFRGLCEIVDGGWGIPLPTMWLRDCALTVGDPVSVILTAEGPLRAYLTADLAMALAAEPKAAAFWDALAPFYRRAYVKWVEGASRRPEVWAARTAKLVGLLKAGIKARPKPGA
jgi:hypothetical protein